MNKYIIINIFNKSINTIIDILSIQISEVRQLKTYVTNTQKKIHSISVTLKCLPSVIPVRFLSYYLTAPLVSGYHSLMSVSIG